eukprot:GGOE01065134.1.p2 GENE.GGOE01065134.1~~GGOE01065134.1.p2  ORF type:complete len:241 (+),score=50.44 GGOE01065134.1:75-725(+)
MSPIAILCTLTFICLLTLTACIDVCANHRSVGDVTYVDTEGPGTPVLLLHGARFSHIEWCRIGTIQVLHDHGFRVLALDLPGFGQSAGPHWESHADLATWLRQRGVQRAVVVAPSMSGALALPLVVEEPGAVLGLVGVAPAGLRAAKGTCSVPCLFMYGEADPWLVHSRVAAEAFAGRSVAVIASAKHACYLDDPDRWHTLLLQFVQEVRQATQTQ